MKGAIVEGVGAEPKVVDNLKRPKPGPGQVLVKSLWVAINPVDAFMAMSGLLVVEWPLVLAVDASGVVIESSPEAESQYGMKPGTYVFGCTRLGMTEYAAGQEYFLMDAAVTVPTPLSIDLKQAATLGVSLDTAALAIFNGLHLPLFDPEAPVTDKDEWVVVLGGGSSVGSGAIQLLRAAGYPVLASCSSRSDEAVRKLGAEPFDYKTSFEEQVEAVLKASGGRIAGVFDAAASDDPQFAKTLFKHSSFSPLKKLFTTTNDWSGIADFEGGETYLVQLGRIGRPDALELNEAIASYVPLFVKLIESGKIKPGDYQVVGSGGFEDVIDAYKQKVGGASGHKKLIVKIQNE